MVRTAGTAAQFAAGAVVFLPTLVFLLADSNRSFSAWLWWALPLAVWFSSLFAPSHGLRPVIQAFAGFFLVAAVFLSASSIGWIPVTTVCFAVIIGSIFNLPTRAAAVVVAISTLLDLAIAYTTDTSQAVFGVTQLVPWAGGLLQLCAGGGLLIAWHIWMRLVATADEEFLSIQALREREYQETAVQEGTAAVARRIHETVLNTFAAISMGIDSQRESEARAACQRDLDQMQRNFQQLDACAISEVVNSALSTIQPTSLACTVNIDDDCHVSAPIANALHDAMVEALRNVERHSGVSSCEISISVDSNLLITITDEGVGPAEVGIERFGLRNSLRANMTSLGGQANIEANQSGGTTVNLRIPRENAIRATVPSFPILGAADATLFGRLGAAGTNIFMLLILMPVVQGLPSTGLFVAANVGYIITVFSLALAWKTPARPWLNWLAILLLGTPFVVASLTPLTCAATPAVQGLITGASGGAALLILIANTDLWRRLFIVAIAVLGPLAVTLRLPTDCRVDAAISVSVTATYLAAIVGVLTWIALGFEVSRTQARDSWEQLVQESAARDHQAAITRGWDVVGRNARDLLEGISDGTISPYDPEARTRAEAESAQIRAALGLILEPGNAFGVLTRRLVRIALHNGCRIDAEALTKSSRTDPLPEEVMIEIETMIRECPDEMIVLRAFTDQGFDEIAITLPARNGFDESVRFVDDVAIQVEIVGDRTIVLVRRPAH